MITRLLSFTRRFSSKKEHKFLYVRKSEPHNGIRSKARHDSEPITALSKKKVTAFIKLKKFMEKYFVIT